MNKPHQEKRKGLRGLRDKIKNATENISNRINEVTTNVKEVVAENNLQTVKQNIQEKNQYKKDLESSANKYDETTKVSKEDILSLENLGEYDIDTDTVVNVSKFTDHNTHAARERNRLEGGDGTFSMNVGRVGAKGRNLGYFASGNKNNPIPQSTRNLIYNKKSFLDFISGGNPELNKKPKFAQWGGIAGHDSAIGSAIGGLWQKPGSESENIYNQSDWRGATPMMKKPGWVKGGLWDTNTKKKKAKAKKATKQQKQKKK
jgi:hypothetical protein